jgi:hypothetical protein
MAKRQIKHRLGQVEYDYNDQIPWTENDQKMADGLARCVLTSEGSMEQTDIVFNQAVELSKRVEAANEQYKSVQEAMQLAQTIASGYVGAIELNQFSIAETLSEAVNIASAMIAAQGQELLAIYDEYATTFDARNRVFDQAEEDNVTVYDELNGLFTLGYHTEGLATELMSFEDAKERLQGLISMNDRTEENKLDYVLEVNRDYELLQARVEGLHQVWEEFASRLLLIEYIGKLRSGHQELGIN